MIDLGEHAAFILLSYGAMALVLTLVVGWLYLDGERQKKALKALEDRGLGRGSRDR